MRCVLASPTGFKHMHTPGGSLGPAGEVAIGETEDNIEKLTTRAQISEAAPGRTEGGPVDPQTIWAKPTRLVPKLAIGSFHCGEKQKEKRWDGAGAPGLQAHDSHQPGGDCETRWASMGCVGDWFDQVLRLSAGFA